MEHQIFQKILELQIIVCLQCKHAVHPREVNTHLQKKHYIKPRDSTPIAQAIARWEDIIQHPEDVCIPRVLDYPLPVIPIHTNGLLCQKSHGTTPCMVITTSIKSMRNHWKEAHGWTQHQSHGRIPAVERQEQQVKLQQSFCMVAWQQVFPSRRNSHLVHIQSRDPEPEEPPAPVNDREQIVAEIKARAAAEEQETASQAVQAGELHDANPWLRMTRWARYLAGVDYQDLLDVVATPDLRQADPIGQATRVVLDTMNQLARRSQFTVQHCGNGIRMAAVSTMRNQTPYQPLRAYMDEKSIQDHVRPWQQILLFIIRTQTNWPWRKKQPGYVMTARQQKTWQRLWQMARQGEPEPGSRSSPDPMEMDDRPDPARIQPFIMTPLETACLDFCIKLLNQKIKVHEYESPLVCAMAALGRGEKAWRDPDSYPPIISRVLKVARFMIVQKALWLDAQHMDIICMWAAAGEQGSWTGEAADNELAFITDEGYEEGSEDGVDAIPSSPPSSPPSSRNAMPIGRIPRSQRMPFQAGVDWMVQKFMVRGQHGPVEVLLDWRTFGLKIHYNTTTPGHVTWMGQERLLYKEMNFTMGEFRGLIHGVVGAARELMGGLLCQPDRDQWPAIPWQALFDNPTEGSPGWSFLQDQRTVWPVTGQHWLVNRIAGEPAVARAFTTQGEVSSHKIDKYFQQVARFKEKLAVAVHLTGGAPARAPELLSIQHVNTETNQRRNIFIEDGMVVVVTAYHKGFHATNDVKIIHRYLPREVGELVIWYLWLVLPFVRQLAVTWRRMAAGDPPSHRSHRSPYLWGPDVGSGREWSSERFREVLKRESKTGMGMQHPLNVANYRDIAIGISRRFLRPSSAFLNNSQAEQEQAMAAAEADEDPDGLGGILDEQAGHTPHVAGMIYGREITDLEGSTTTRRLRFRASSMDWHRFLGFLDEDRPVLGKRGNPWEEQAVHHQVQRQAQLQAMNMEQALQRMTGRAEITFRGVQGPAIKAIQDGASPVVAVMPTGGGKSMLFMLPAYAAPGGCTIVVVPLISLQADLLKRCQELGIRCVSWESRHPPDEAAIVLVTPELTEHPDFHTFLNRQRLMRRLDRIVIDECHVILNPQKDFRPAMARLGRLASAQTQMVFLTATLPPASEAMFFHRIKHQAREVGIYRARTSRPNIAYRVFRPVLPRGVPWEPHQWLTSPGVLDVIQERIRQARPGRVIIYANLKTQVEAISREIGCEPYHSEVLDRMGVMQRFQDGQTRVIAATSALGMGIDIPNIRSVIHIGRPRTLLEYGQESGRAGRDGRASEAVIIHPHGWDTSDSWVDQVTEADFHQVQSYMEVVEEGSCCRRYILDRFLDGTVDGYTRQQCQDLDPRELPCDVCDPDWEAQEQPASPSQSRMSCLSSMSCRSSMSCPSSMSKPEEMSMGDSPHPMGNHPRPAPVNRPRFGRSPSNTLMPSQIPRAPSIESDASFMTQVPCSFPIPPAVEPAMEPAIPLPVQPNQAAGPAVVPLGSQVVVAPPRRPQYHPAAIRQQAEAIQAGIDREFIEQEARRWLNQCYVCTTTGRDGDHELYACRDPGGQPAKQWMIQIRNQVDYIPFQSCYVCGMPQSICFGWKAGHQCTWRGALIPVIAGMLHGPRGAAVRETWQRHLHGRRVEGRVVFPQKPQRRVIEPHVVDTHDLQSMAAFLGQGTPNGEGVEMQAAFCWLRRACIELEGLESIYWEACR